MAMSDYVEQRTIDFWLKANAEFSTTAPTTVYIALFTTATTDAGGGTEVSGGAYARESVTFSTMSAVTNGTSSNTADIDFTQATASWGTITHAAIYDAVSGGNMLFHGALNTSKAIDSGDIFRFLTGDFSAVLS